MNKNKGSEKKPHPPKQILLGESDHESDTKLTQKNSIWSKILTKEAGFIFLPALILIAIFAGIEAEEGGGMKCSAHGNWSQAENPIEIKGREYSVYSVDKDDFRMISAAYIPPGTDRTCDVFTDWNLKNNDGFHIQVDVDIYGEIHEHCEDGAHRCEVAVRQGGQEWIELNPRDSNQVGAYFAYDDRGFLEGGQISVAVDSENRLGGIEVTVGKSTEFLFWFSFLIVPVGGTVGFFLAKRTGYDNFNQGIVSSIKVLLRIGLVGLIGFVGLLFLILMTW